MRLYFRNDIVAEKEANNTKCQESNSQVLRYHICVLLIIFGNTNILTYFRYYYLYLVNNRIITNENQISHTCRNLVLRDYELFSAITKSYFFRRILDLDLLGTSRFSNYESC